MHQDLKSLDAADLAVDTSVDAVPTASLILIARPVLVVDLLLAFQLVVGHRKKKSSVLYSAFVSFLCFGYQHQYDQSTYHSLGLAAVSVMVVMELPDKTVAAASESSFPLAAFPLAALSVVVFPVVALSVVALSVVALPDNLLNPVVDKPLIVFVHHQLPALLLVFRVHQFVVVLQDQAQQ